ncbi:MAG TPA: tetratricopeptide repeat protein [Candidatus Sulfotelmatobacter sp.]|nr:tetratricopeptide repeat protein [Candidatus Sulfotelmatobacter sp.]
MTADVGASGTVRTLADALERARAHLVAGRLTEAETGYREVLATVPAVAQALHELGVCRHRQGDIAGAVPLIAKATALAPEVAEYHSNLGVMLRATGRVADAEAALRRALAVRPGYPTAAANLGNLLAAEGRAREAADAYRSALATEPDYVEARFMLASALLEQGQLADAETELRALIGKQPEVARHHVALSKVLQRGGRLADAEAACRAALALSPSVALDDANAAWLSIVGHLGRFGPRGEIRARLAGAVAARADTDPVDAGAFKRFAYLFPYYGFDDASHLRVLGWLGRALAQAIPAAPLPDPGPAEPLRVGFLSGDFGDHPIGHLLSPVFEALDRTRVQSFLFSIGQRSGETSAFRRRLKDAAFQFRGLEGASVAQCVQAVRADRLHVLIDLNGYLAGGLPELLANRAAPLQIHWIMHLGGMPAPFIDYTITDRVIVPDTALDAARGPLIRLPDAFQAGDRHPIADVALTRKQYGLPERGFVYCAFNNRLKIDEAAFDSWMRILAAVPGSVLWLSAAADPEAEQELAAAARERGIDPARLVLATREPDKATHFARHRFAGLFLDTFTFGAATTATDALWAGLPVLSKSAEVAHGRIGESLLRAVGMPEMVARDAAEYEARAIEIGRTPALAAKLRRALVGKLPTAPYFDAARFARALETALVTAWQSAAAGQPPASFDVAAAPAPAKPKPVRRK